MTDDAEPQLHDENQDVIELRPGVTAIINADAQIMSPGKVDFRVVITVLEVEDDRVVLGVTRTADLSAIPLFLPD